MRKRMGKKLAFTLSFLLMFLWAILGTGTSLAWFADTDTEIRNVIRFGRLDVEMSQRQEDGTYGPVEQGRPVFNDGAIYEPGYVQVVYLRIENKGTVSFDYRTAVMVTDYTVGTNRFGKPILLQEYLRFGVVIEKTESALLQKVEDRQGTKDCADRKLNNYATEPASLEPGEMAYLALIVRMPEDVGNEANDWNQTPPMVELGLIVTASQHED